VSIPDSKQTIQDGALGVVETNDTGVQAKIGVCSLGTPNQVYTFADPTALQAALGTGPLVEAAVEALQEGGGPIVCVPATPSVAGTNGAVTHAGTGTSVMTVTGTPKDSYEVIAKVTNPGTVTAGDGTFQYSLDKGRTWSGDIAGTATYAVPNTGLTLNFTTASAATLVKDDTYTFTSTAPGYANSDLTAALTALVADPASWFMVHVVGQPADLTAAAAIFALLDAFMAAQETAYRYAFALMDLPDDTDANIKTSFTSLAASSRRVQVAAGFGADVSRVNGALYKRPVGWPAAARMGAIRPSVDPGRFRDGPLTGFSLPKGFGFRDESLTPGLDAIGLVTARTYRGVPGVYLTKGRMKSPAGSDFGTVMNRRVCDILSATVRHATLQYVNDSIRVDATTGKILEIDARGIEAFVGGEISAALVQPGDASSASVVVDRTNNILSTSELKISERVVPKGYASTITNTVGFNNPALNPVTT